MLLVFQWTPGQHEAGRMLLGLPVWSPVCELVGCRGWPKHGREHPAPLAPAGPDLSAGLLSCYLLSEKL